MSVFPFASTIVRTRRPEQAPHGPITREDAAGPHERTLIDHARSDPAAFEILYRRHYRRVLAYLVRRTGDPHAAEDLAAQTFIAAWRALGRYRHTGAPFEAWLLRIATNETHRWLKRAARRNVHERGAPVRADQPSVANDREELRRAMRTLSAAHQDAIALVYFESMSIEQAAGVLGVRPGTVKSRLARAREALMHELHRRGVNE